MRCLTAGSEPALSPWNSFSSPHLWQLEVCFCFCVHHRRLYGEQHHGRWDLTETGRREAGIPGGWRHEVGGAMEAEGEGLSGGAEEDNAGREGESGLTLSSSYFIWQVWVNISAEQIRKLIVICPKYKIFIREEDNLRKLRSLEKDNTMCCWMEGGHLE